MKLPLGMYPKRGKSFHTITIMKSKKISMLTFLLLTGWAISAQVTSYNYDPGKINKEQAATMDSLYQEDQQYRQTLVKLKKENAPQNSLDSLAAIIKNKDSLNLIFVEKWIDKHGWPGPEGVGFQGVQALFLVIQHADLKIQKKYYPLIKKAESESKMLSSNVAIMEDRIAVREGRNQPYGSQFYYDAEMKKNIVYPVADIEKLEQFRKSMGLQPMNEYLKDWSVEAYKLNLMYAQKLLDKLKAKH